MPLILFFARQFIILGVQLGIFGILDKYIVPLLNTVIEKTMILFGVNEDTASDIVANEVITTAETLGLAVLLSKAKLPLKLADKLKFTTKGFAKRKLPAEVETKVIKVKTGGVVDTVVTKAGLDATIETVAKTKGLTISRVSQLANLIVAVIGVPIGAGLLIINTIDFAAWPTSSYTQTFQKFFAFFGLKQNTPMANSKVLSDDMWDKILATYRNLGAVGINDPYKNMSVLFSRKSLADLVDKVAANIIADKGKATMAEVIGATQGFIVMSGEVTDEKITRVFGTTVTQPTTTPVKIFTGVVTQGTLGDKIEFEARQDDLIENTNELKTSAQNNLVSFLTALPGRIVYEIKVVSSIITADGFKQTGTTQQIISGYYKDGTPKYKTVTNKFAVAIVYALTEKGSRTKLATIVLGPVNSAKLRVNTNDLMDLQNSIKSEIYTTDIKEISGIETTQSITVSSPEETTKISVIETPTVKVTPVTQVILDDSYFVERDGFGGIIWRDVGTEILSYIPSDYMLTTEEKVRAGNYGGQMQIAKEMLKKMGIDIDTIRRDPFPYEYKMNLKRRAVTTHQEFFGKVTKIDVGGGEIGTKAGADAKTLYEWYQAQGLTLPSVQVRSKIYENLGLGQANYYTGTAEQNTKLLTALKG